MIKKSDIKKISDNDNKLFDFIMENDFKCVKFLDRTFNVNPNRFLKICKILENTKNTYQFEIEAELFNDEVVDYLVNAGYNPVSLIVVMNKAFPQGRYDWYKTHPLTSRRMMEIYEYIYKKYPEYLANNTYKENMYYQNFLLTSKENRTKFQKKIESNSKRSINYL